MSDTNTVTTPVLLDRANDIGATIRFSFTENTADVRFGITLADKRRAEGVVMPCRMS